MAGFIYWQWQVYLPFGLVSPYFLSLLADFVVQQLHTKVLACNGCIFDSPGAPSSK